ncbi:MAG: polyprenyl synthetase family protein [Pseudomonadales bacterium]|nr:polyprenyl synthetase family protein [Pseudomonadales bacterium]
MNFSDIQATVAKDFDAVNTLIMEQLSSNVPLIGEVGSYIINSGGKRLRPLVSLLSANAFNYKGTKHITVGAVTEFLHTATLLHDDVVDQSNMRRGNATVNSVWGNAHSVLVGDFLISRSFQMMVSLNNLTLLDILADATNAISEGEVLQLINIHDPDTTEESYMKVIRYKTAKMFEVAAESGAVLANQEQDQIQAMRNYARHMGAAFQLADDILDYTGSAKEMGKNVGDDLAEGKPTMPLIYVLNNGSPEQSTIIRKAIKEGGLDNLDEIIETVKSSGAIEYTHEFALNEARLAAEALSIVPASKYRDALEALARLAVERTS